MYDLFNQLLTTGLCCLLVLTLTSSELLTDGLCCLLVLTLTSSELCSCA